MAFLICCSVGSFCSTIFYSCVVAGWAIYYYWLLFFLVGSRVSTGALLSPHTCEESGGGCRRSKPVVGE